MSEAAFVYVMGSDTKPQKIGIAKDVALRKQFMQVGCPFDMITHHTEPTDNAAAVERLAHAYLAPYRQRGEWYNVEPPVAIAVVKRAARDAARGKVAPKNVHKMDGVVWLQRYANLPYRLGEAALAYRGLAELCSRGAEAFNAAQSEGISFRRVVDAKAGLKRLHDAVSAAHGEDGVRALTETAYHGKMPTPGLERQLIGALDIVSQRMEDTICA